MLKYDIHNFIETELLTQRCLIISCKKQLLLNCFLKENDETFVKSLQRYNSKHKINRVFYIAGMVNSSSLLPHIPPPPPPAPPASYSCSSYLIFLLPHIPLPAPPPPYITPIHPLFSYSLLLHE